MKSKAFIFNEFQNMDGSTDSLDFYYINKEGNYDYYIGTSNTIVDDRLNFNSVRPIIGNDYFRFEIRFKRDGIWNTMIDSIYVAKGDTITDVIYY